VATLQLFLSLTIIFLSSFFLTYFVTPIMIRKISKRGIVGKDMNKIGKPKVAEMGGISLMLGISLGIIIATFISTYLGILKFDLKILFASFLTIFFVGFIGVIDDLIGWRTGIRQWQHALFPLFAALPLMAINAGTKTFFIPFLGEVNVGIFYSLLLVPLGITGASNALNMLAGFNGLEAGLGVLIVSTLSLISFMTGKIEALIIGIAILASLLAFLRYNWYPAKVFGGDSLTLMIGASIATISIIGNMEKVGVLIIALHWIELVFKAKHKFQSQSFGIPQKDGTLAPDPRGGSLTHFIMKQGRFTEQQVVLILLSAQTIVCLIVFGMFYFKLF
jgi:UDP-N-acetylglucosamine--dolichyl-phosphate N-acetylglucosaminephosphotransferase